MPDRDQKRLITDFGVPGEIHMNRDFALVVCVAVLDIDPPPPIMSWRFPVLLDLEDNAVEERRLDGHAGPANMAVFSPTAEDIALRWQRRQRPIMECSIPGKPQARLNGHRAVFG